MTKREFIKRLHFASQEFRQDLGAFESFLSSLKGSDNGHEALAAVAARSEELDQKWPRARDFIDWPKFADWSKSPQLSDVKALFADLTLQRAKLDGIELDPWVTSPQMLRGILEEATGEDMRDLPAEELFSTERNTPLEEEFKRNQRPR